VKRPHQLRADDPRGSEKSEEKIDRNQDDGGDGDDAKPGGHELKIP
jgi:hypothetical protein